MKRIVLLFCLINVCYMAARADGYWLDIKGSGKAHDTLFIKVRYGGVGDDKSRYIKNGPELDKLSGFKVMVLDNAGKQVTVPVQQKQDAWEGFFIPATDGGYRVLAINDQLPVVERPDTLQNIRPIQYLCALYTVGNYKPAPAAPQQFLDISVSRKDNGALVLQPFMNKQPLPAGTKLRVFDPVNNDEYPVTNKNGEAFIVTDKQGLYIIRLDWVDNKPGVYNGKKYQSIRHRCDYAYLFTTLPLK